MIGVGLVLSVAFSQLVIRKDEAQPFPQAPVAH
jgi:hypothetical protein